MKYYTILQLINYKVYIHILFAALYIFIFFREESYINFINKICSFSLTH